MRNEVLDYVLACCERNKRIALRVGVALPPEQAEAFARASFASAAKGDRIAVPVALPVESATVSVLRSGPEGKLEPAAESSQKLASPEVTVTHNLTGDLWLDEGALTLYGRWRASRER